MVLKVPEGKGTIGILAYCHRECSMVASTGYEKDVPERRSGKSEKRENSLRFQYQAERISASVRRPLQYG